MDRNVSPYTTSLHRGNAYWMARLAQEVYRRKSPQNPMPDVDAMLDSLLVDDSGFNPVYGYDNNSAQAALFDHRDYLCMSFRGTDQLLEWLDNIKVFAVKALFGEFHRGFWHSLHDVWEPINDDFRALQKKHKRPLFITGHSLGGAMATVAAAHLVHEDKPFTGLYTFGQPRVLSRATARVMNSECRSRFFRFHNNNDIVTRVPPRLMGYSHAGTYLYISQEGQIHMDSGFWSRFIDYIDGALEAAREKGIDGVEDHRMATYFAAISDWQLG